MPDAPDIDLAVLVEPVQAIAREAGRRILEVYAGAFSVTEKADQSPVTAADLAAPGVEERRQRGALVGIEPVEIDRLDTRFG